MNMPYADYAEDVDLEYLVQLGSQWTHLTNVVTSLAAGTSLRCHLAFMLSAAYCCGWTPAWTQPPQDFEGSGWTGTYIAHQKPIVTACDAQAMALAVQKALPLLAGATEACGESMYLSCCFYGLLTANEVIDTHKDARQEDPDNPDYWPFSIGMPPRYPQHLNDLLPVEGSQPIFQDGAGEIHAFIALCRQGAFFIEG